jgi:hypothetical protein
MQLSYRGAHYESHLPNLEADVVEEIGTYRGAPCRRKQFKLNHPHHRQVDTMTYRGVTYTREA